MKKTFPANIDGQVFYIDEDAYELLNNYLNQLSITFKGDEGKEIVSDIESRIRELFIERLANGSAVVTLTDVQNVITTMGRPEEINEQTVDYEDDGAAVSESAATPPPSEKFRWSTTSFCSRHRLFRNMQDKVFGGVFGGLAAYLGWNANIMRILYVALACCTYFWPLTIIYLIAWMIIPPAVTPRQVLEMKGQPVSVDSIGQTLIAPPTYHEDSGHIITSALKVAGRVVMAFVGFFSGIGLLACTLAFICLVTAMISYGAFGSVTILKGFNLFMYGSNAAQWLVWWAAAISLLAIIMVLVALFWAACCVVFKTRGASRSTIITWAVTLLVLIAVASCLVSAYHGIM